MSYRINPTLWDGVFAVPSAVVDRHIKLAGEIQLKVLLWILRKGCANYTADEIAGELGVALSDVKDALLYWIDSGVLQPRPDETGEASAPAEAAAAAQTAQTRGPKRQVIRPAAVKPTQKDIAERASASPDLKVLFEEAQAAFGRTLSMSEQSTLLWIYDYCGMPTEVITMLMEYESIGKKLTMNNVEKQAANWCELGIDSIDRAEAFITERKKAADSWYRICSMFCIDKRKPTKREEEYIKRWCGEWKFSDEIIKLAYEENIDQTAKLSFAYINAILKRWHENGIKTPEDVEKSKETFLKEKKSALGGPEKGKSQKKDTEASYDLGAYSDLLMNNGELFEKYGHLLNSKGEDN